VLVHVDLLRGSMWLTASVVHRAGVNPPPERCQPGNRGVDGVGKREETRGYAASLTDVRSMIGTVMEQSENDTGRRAKVRRVGRPSA
jgi:hypothetical protein